MNIPSNTENIIENINKDTEVVINIDPNPAHQKVIVFSRYQPKIRAIKLHKNC